MKCPACYGSGIDQGNRPEDDCPKCGGAGQIADAIETNVDWMRRVADAAQPHITDLCKALRLDPERDPIAVKALMRDVLLAACKAVATTGSIT